MLHMNDILIYNEVETVVNFHPGEDVTALRNLVLSNNILRRFEKAYMADFVDMDIEQGRIVIKAFDAGRLPPDRKIVNIINTEIRMYRRGLKGG